MKKIVFLLISCLFLTWACNDEYVMPPHPGRMIKQFSLEQGQIGEAVISRTAGRNRVVVTVGKTVNLKAVIPLITISDKATISPGSGQVVDVSATKTIEYTVTAESGQMEIWEVVFVVFDPAAIDYASYTIKNVAAAKYLQVAGNIKFTEKYRNNQKIDLFPAGSEGVADIWQKWKLIYKLTENNIRYYEMMNLHSGKLLTSPGTAGGAELLQLSEKAVPGGDQLWEIREKSAQGAYSFINKGNGMAISYIASVGSNPKVIQETVSTDSKQQWNLSPISEESYRDDKVVTFFERNLPSQGSVAFDQGTSIPLSDGRVLWITQDAWDGVSLRDGNVFDCNHFFSYNNSVMIQPSKTDWDPAHTPNMTIANSAHNRPKQVFNNQPGTTWSWPGLGVQIGNDVWVQCGEGKDLNATNQSLYKLNEVAGNQWSAVRFTPEGMSNQVAVSYSTGMVKSNDGYIYSFGTSGTGITTTNVFVARFPQSDPMKWTFWDGSKWADRPTNATEARVSPGMANVSVSYWKGKYVMMNMTQGFFCDNSVREIYMSYSDSPTGPFTTPKKVYDIVEYFKGSYARYYTPAIHPEFDNGRNELLLTYCLNVTGCDLSWCENGGMDPYYYRVKGLRVPASMIFPQ
ncbi:RICIN domain-containing protein [Arcticibacter tournemirensis]